MADYLSYLFGGVVIVGGIIGFAKAGSVMSLASGGVFGALVLYGAYRTSNDPKDFLFLFGTSAVLMCLMGYRMYLTGKFMPAGLVTVLSLMQVGRLAIRFTQ